MSGVRFGRVLALAAATSLALAGCAGGGSGSSSSGDTLKIGFMGDLTGENSGHRDPAPQWRAARDRRVQRHEPEDQDRAEALRQPGQARPGRPRWSRTAIGTDKITALIGPAFSGESKAIGGRSSRARSRASRRRRPTRAWRRTTGPTGTASWPTTTTRAPAIANFLITAQVAEDGVRHLRTTRSTASASRTRSTRPSRARASPSSATSSPKDASDYSSTVQKVKAANPDIITFGGYYAQAGRAAQAAPRRRREGHLRHR